MIHVFVRILQLMALFCAGFLVTAAQAADLATQWQGAYGYGDSRAPVPFTFTLNVNGGAVSGRITEPATFGNGTSSNLYANISGSTDGTHISFTKTYDGHGGQTHSVSYSGTIGSDGASMSGSWQLPGSSGTWQATALNRAAGHCINASSQFRTTDGSVYWDFQNVCDHVVMVNICKFTGDGHYNPLAVNVPARGNAAISLGLTTQGPYKVSPPSERAIPCSP